MRIYNTFAMRLREKGIFGYSTRRITCTATGNSGHSPNQGCGIIFTYLKGVSNGEPNENEEDSLLSFRSKVVLEALLGESSQAELCRRHNLSEDQFSKWKQQFVENAASLFASTDKHSGEAAERIAHLEQFVGRLTVALEIQKKH